MNIFSGLRDSEESDTSANADTKIEPDLGVHGKTVDIDANTEKVIVKDNRDEQCSLGTEDNVSQIATRVADAGGDKEEGENEQRSSIKVKKNRKVKKQEKHEQKAAERKTKMETEKKQKECLAYRLELKFEEAVDTGTDTKSMEIRLSKKVDIPRHIHAVDRYRWKVDNGFQPSMNVDVIFYANEELCEAIFQEMGITQRGGFLPAVKQLANVTCLPGIVEPCIGMPDIHSGYGFAVGSVAAMDLSRPEAVISPGGVGFDINCGVRLLRSSLKYNEMFRDKPKKLNKLLSSLFDEVPTGVGTSSKYKLSENELKEVLDDGMEWCLRNGYCWKEDLDQCEDRGRMKSASSAAVSTRAKKRGLLQLGTLGSGNHYLELQRVDEIYDKSAADAMGLDLDTVCVMIHCGSRGLGHQVCTDSLQSMPEAAKSQGIHVPDKQLLSVRYTSEEGKKYFKAMNASANYAFANRTLITKTVRDTFKSVLGKDPLTDLEMHMVYDVCHNMAKVERHVIAEKECELLVHRKGATRAFDAHHPDVPDKYKHIGQPILIGGSMGTCSYVLVGTNGAMRETFGSSCHGAGRMLSRCAAKQKLNSTEIMESLRSKDILAKVKSPNLITEEADEAYKDVCLVVDTCHRADISKMVVKLKPFGVIKG